MKESQEMEQLFKHYMGGLSEDIQQKLDLVIKGNQLLHKEIREVHDVLRQEIRSVGDRSDQ